MAIGPCPREHYPSRVPRRRPAAALVALALFALAGCGDVGASGDENNAAELNQSAETSQPRVPTCQEPSGQEKFALRSAVRTHERELKDAPWVRVHYKGAYYMAAEIAGPATQRLVVLVNFPEGGTYLEGMQALNATAREFTDLPEVHQPISRGGGQVLRCMTQRATASR